MEVDDSPDVQGQSPRTVIAWESCSALQQGLKLQSEKELRQTSQGHCTESVTLETQQQTQKRL
jgi:hypothetical protein